MFKSQNAAFVAPVPLTNPDDATKQALLAVVQVWLDRLQAMTVITTFFMSIDTMVYSFAPPSPDPDTWSAANLLITASLGGAIIFHVCASILAYMGSFVLIRYRLNDAERQEQATEKTQSGRQQNLSLGPVSPSEIVHELSWDAYIDLRSLVSVYRAEPFSDLFRCKLRKAGVKRGDPEASGKDDAVTTLKSMVQMLSRCHTLTTIMTQLGFVLALVGILAYFWTGLPKALGIFASAILGGCLFAGALVVV